jgi:hypothetical protein
MSAKILEKCAVRLELATDTSAGWGAAASILTPTTGDLLPYTSLEKGMTPSTVEDNSIGPAGFSDTPVQTGLMVEKSLALNAWYSGLDAILYWIFGFENNPSAVCLFTLSTPSVEPVANSSYHDVDGRQFTFWRKEVQRSATYYVFQTVSPAPTLATGNLTKDSGTGDTTLTFSAHSPIMYEHTFELDANTRHIAAFPTAEQISGYSSGMRKNRCMTIGVSTSVTDLLYPNAMCKKFDFKSAAGQIANIGVDYVAHSELRGDYSSSGWTLPSDFVSNVLEMIHHQLRFKIGETESTLVNLGVSDVSYGLEIPLDSIQDTESGLYISEPRMEGKYKNTLEAKLSRYAATTYAGYRDAWTSVCGVLEAYTGYYGFELMFNNMKIVNAGPDTSAVESEPLKFEFGNASNAFPIRLFGTTLRQGGPVVCRVRNANSVNSMFNDA